MQSYNSLGLFIAQRRDELGISQTELARTVEISQGQISCIETGQTQKPHKKTLKRIATALRIPVENLYNLAGYPLPKKIYFDNESYGHINFGPEEEENKTKKTLFLEDMTSEKLPSVNWNNMANIVNIMQQKLQEIEKNTSEIKNRLPSGPAEKEKSLPPGAMQMRVSEEPCKMPLVENISCGTLSAILSTSGEMIDVPPRWKNKGDFVVKIQGNSMKEEGILDGMLVLIKEKPVPDPGDICLVFGYDTNSEEPNGVLKKAKYLDGNTLVLLNGSGETIDLGERYTVVGKVQAWMTDI